MRRNITKLLLVMALLIAAAPGPGTQAQSGLPVERITLPPGFSIEVFADELPAARSLAVGDAGTVFVGTRGPDRVYALSDTDGDGLPDVVRTIGSGLNMPNGVVFFDGALYVATITHILRYDDIENHLDNPPDPVIVYDQLPDAEHHGWRYLRIGPDEKLYLGIGAPCNICEPEEDIFGIIVRLNLDGTEREIVARGVRNTVGLDFDPANGDLWFTDNGRDWISDDLPPDELNHVTEIGQHFGYPYCHGGFLQDIDFGDKHDCSEFTAPAQNLGAHVASLGLRFYTGDMFPAEYQGQIFIAEHGSWNRTDPLGARITLVRRDETGAAVSYEVFAEGWQNPDGTRWGRPVDVLVMPDGALLVSDDAAGAVYRISYTG